MLLFQKFLNFLSFVQLVSGNLASAQIEARLREATLSDVERAHQAACHIVLAGGKRIRPRLALLAAEAVGLPSETALVIGTAAELVHTATLLHDDVIDQSDLRRGRITVNAKFGVGSAILTGDFLLSQALHQLLHADLYLATRELALSVRNLAEAELLQLERAFDPQTTIEETRRIALGKTAALFIWTTRAVALTASALPSIVEAASAFGRALGYAYQVADDLLDFCTTSVSGKPRGKDLREGQVTMPMQLLRQIDPHFAAVLRGALLTRQEGAIEAAYAILRNGQAEELAQREIAIAANEARRNLTRLASHRPALSHAFEELLEECTQRFA